MIDTASFGIAFTEGKVNGAAHFFIEEDIFAFDPREFQALGRDVGAEIVTVPAEAAHDALVSRLLPALKGAFGRWEAEDESRARGPDRG